MRKSLLQKGFPPIMSDIYIMSDIIAIYFLTAFPLSKDQEHNGHCDDTQHGTQQKHIGGFLLPFA